MQLSQQQQPQVRQVNQKSIQVVNLRQIEEKWKDRLGQLQALYEQQIIDLQACNEELHTQLQDLRQQAFAKEQDYITQISELQSQVESHQQQAKFAEQKLKLKETEYFLLEQKIKQFDSSTRLLSPSLSRNNLQNSDLHDSVQKKNSFSVDHGENDSHHNPKVSQEKDALKHQVENLIEQNSRLQLQVQLNSQWKAKFVELNKKYHQTQEQYQIMINELECANQQLNFNNKRRSHGSLS